MNVAQGCCSRIFYWDINDQTRAFSKRFAQATRRDAEMGRRVYFGRAALPEGNRALKSDEGDKVVQDERAADRRPGVRKGAVA